MRKLLTVGQEDLGDGQVIFEWSPKGDFVAVAGNKRVVNIYDRNGKLSGEIHLAAKEVVTTDARQCSCLQLQWHPSGEVLAALPAGCSFVYTWNTATKELQKLDTDFRAQEVSMVSWAKTSPVLAVGTVKGNLQLYHIREKRRIPIVGKHTKKVCNGVWTKDNLLAMASLDKTVTVSDQSGDTLKTIAFKGEPLELCVATCKEDRKSSAGGGSFKREENSFSLITSKKVLYIMQGLPSASSPPLELSFLESYGAMSRHVWFGDGYVMVGFKSGQVVVVSSLSKEMNEEVQCHKPLDLLTDIAYCPALSRVAVGGGSSVKLIDVGAEYGEVAGEGIELPPGHSVEKLGWGQDGQILSVSTSNGLFACYLAALPSVFAAHGTKVASLTSISEMTVHDTATRSSVVVQVACEPAVCSLGPAHLAVGMNNQVVYYNHGGQGPVGLVSRRSYLGAVQAVYLNATHVAVQTDGRLLLHTIKPSSQQHRQQHDDTDEIDADICLPKTGTHQQDPIVCAALSQFFVITATASGSLTYYLVQDGELGVVNEHRHTGGIITHLFPQPAGPRLVLADDRMLVALYSPLNDEMTALPEFEGSLQQLLWDVEDPNLFVAVNSNGEMWAYHFVQQSVSGQKLELLCKTVLLKGHFPVVLADGRLSLRMKTGAMDHWVLDSHKPLHEQGNTAKHLQRRLAACVKLCRLPDALQAAAALGTADAWRQLGSAAMQLLDVELAVAAFRQAHDSAMVMSLASLQGIEDRSLLAGSLLLLMEKDYNQAQELLLRSSRPIAALEMRKDLKHWPQALALAQQLAPASVPALSKEHAAMLEMVGEHAEARAHYQQAWDSLAASGNDPGLQQACLAGVARTTLQLGDLRAGRQLALQADSPALWKECGLILENMQQAAEAAEMYEMAGMIEKAASIHIASKNFTAAQPLMAQVTSAKLQLQYAKAKESEGRWADAAAAYEAAGDLAAVVRLCLDKLGDKGRACAAARKSRSTDAAAQVARHCLAAGDTALAIEFLLLARQLEQAFDVAAAKGAMDIFARLVADSAKDSEEVLRIAQYYEQRGEPEKAADMWAKAAQPEKAVKLYVQVCNQVSLTKAIGVVEDTQNAQLAPAVLDALTDCPGLEEHARDALRFRLNLAAGQLGDAARDALDLVRFEQDEGNYKVAHSKLFSTVQQLKGLGASVPQELMRALALLHSYVLVKSMVGLGDHLAAARMLVRVAGSISRFPKHIVPILTSTVIECQRAGLKRTAFEYASMLMRPEYRSQVSEKYKKKIELMVRKPDRGEEPPENLLPCPFCQLPGPEGELQCVSCQNLIPFDIATGKRMSTQDWCECPSCHMPASSQALLALLSAEGRCPMCSNEVNMQDVVQVANPLSSSLSQQSTSS